jgi:acetyl esterase/lipase
MPPFVESEEARAALYNPLPNNQQLSEYPLGRPGVPPGPRALWHFSNLAKGIWIQQVEFGEDANPASIDPATYIRDTKFPPVMIVQGEEDDSPGSTLDVAVRFAKELKEKGDAESILVPVPAAKHMFDMALGPGQDGWEVIENGLKFLYDRVR